MYDKVADMYEVHQIQEILLLKILVEERNM